MNADFFRPSGLEVAWTVGLASHLFPVLENTNQIRIGKGKKLRDQAQDPSPRIILPMFELTESSLSLLGDLRNNLVPHHNPDADGTGVSEDWVTF
jgi:hypothetical protein